MAVGAIKFAALAAFGALGFVLEEFIDENPGFRGVIGFKSKLEPLKRQAMEAHIDALLPTIESVLLAVFYI